MLQATTLGGQAAALAGSLLFHAGVVIALSGHPPQTRVASAAEPLLVEVSALWSPPAPEAQTAPALPAAPIRRAPVTHTHRYPVAHAHDATPHDPALVHPPVSLSPPADLAPRFALAVAPVSAPVVPRFALDVGAHAARAAASPGVGSASSDAGDGEPVAEAAVDVPARLLRGSPPAYPREAAQAELEADVPLEIVVDARGHVQSARVLRQVGNGLEAASLKALRAYHFSAAILKGRATPVRMKWTMVFRLQ